MTFHDVTPRVSALAGCDRLVSEPLVIEKNEFALHRLPQGKGNMNGWLNEDEDEPLEYEASDKEVESNLEPPQEVVFFFLSMFGAMLGMLFSTLGF
ncbi:hypothetical protein Tco_0758853 [Tanacetum coccineum]